MATELTPDDAVHAIQALTRVLVRTARWQFALLVLALCATGGAFIVSVHTHNVQSDALRQIMQENRAIFARIQALSR